MVAIITFIGWHDSGKTTLATQVVSELTHRGYRVAVIKSTSDRNIHFDTPGTDTSKHKAAGAEAVLLVAPDQMVLQENRTERSLISLASRYFPEVDVVIGEGFKTENCIPKIEVFRNVSKPLRGHVEGVVAVATDIEGVTGENVFRLDEAHDIATFIEKHYLCHP